MSGNPDIPVSNGTPRLLNHTYHAAHQITLDLVDLINVYLPECMGENLIDNDQYCDGAMLAAIQSRNNSSGGIYYIIIEASIKNRFLRQF